jgi:hypothetical protein
MNRQLFFICFATVNLYSGAQAAAMDLSLLGAAVQPKIAKIKKELDALSIEELHAKLDENTAKAKRRSLKRSERSDIALANMVIIDKLTTLGVQIHEE